MYPINAKHVHLKKKLLSYRVYLQVAEKCNSLPRWHFCMFISDLGLSFMTLIIYHNSALLTTILFSSLL